MTLNCDLVSLHGWAMGSAHHFTEANIWPKLKENPSRGKGDIQWTRNSGLKLATLNCDLVLVSPSVSYGFCTSSHRWTFDQSLEKILPQLARSFWDKIHVQIAFSFFTKRLLFCLDPFQIFDASFFFFFFLFVCFFLFFFPSLNFI